MFLDIFHPLLTRKICCTCDIDVIKETKCSYLYGHIDLREQQSYLTYYLHGQLTPYVTLKTVIKNAGLLWQYVTYYNFIIVLL